MKIEKIDDVELNRFNNLLIDNYGYYENLPKFRLVWSTDQVEKRLTKFTKEGFELLAAEIRELPKYRQYLNDRYIIEMLTYIGDNPELSATDLSPLGYEPFWTFEDKNQNFLRPNFTAAKIIIDSMLEIAGVKREKKYNISNDEERKALVKRVDDIEEALYGNESKVGDSLTRDSAVGYGPRMRNDSFDAEAKVLNANRKMFGDN